MTVRRILFALVVVSSVFIAPAGRAETTTAVSGAGTTALGRAAVLAQAASLAQVEGIPRTIELNARNNTSSAAEAVTALASHYGLHPTPSQRDRIASLAGLDGDLQTALADTIEAFTGFKNAASVGTLADVVAARGALLDSVVMLGAFAASTGEHAGICELLDLSPVLLLDTTGCDNVYDPDPVVLSIDFGGDDVYRNNAGGGSIGNGLGMAAAAFDFDGDDLYQQGGPYRLYATNGAGGLGSGFLLDAAGNDTYIGDNGSAYAYGVNTCCLPAFYFPTPGSGFLMDVGGDDVYVGANGYAEAHSDGAVARALLFDASGFDLYRSGPSRPSNADCTVAPKGYSDFGVAPGAQIDFPHTDCP